MTRSEASVRVSDFERRTGALPQSRMLSHRTTARALLALLLLGVVAGTAGAAQAPGQILFPVVGAALYSDDFGDPRGQGRHEGNDILADRHAPVVAVEAGKVEFWTTSARAGCMLYLYGRSGTTYLYVHLNNDLTDANDNRGSCAPGIAYAPGLANGEKVRAGQLVGFVGDSGDANGIHPHLHFELHPHDGAAVSPFKWLQAAERLLFALPGQGEPAPSLALYGTLVAAADGTLTVHASHVRTSNGWRFEVSRDVTLAVPAEAVVERAVDGQRQPAAAGGATLGERVVVWTSPVPETLDAELGAPGILSAAQVLFRGPA